MYLKMKSILGPHVMDMTVKSEKDAVRKDSHTKS